MTAVKRMTFSLSPNTAMNLDAISGRLGISRSGLVEQLLSGACDDLVQVLDLMPTPSDGFTREEAIRLRGRSADLLQRRLDDLQGQVNDL